MVDRKFIDVFYCFSLFIIYTTKDTTGEVESWSMHQQCGRTLESYGGTLHFDAAWMRDDFCQVKIVGKGASDTMLSLFFTSFNISDDSCMENLTMEEPGAVQQNFIRGNIPRGLYKSFCRRTGYLNENSIYTTFQDSLILKYSSRQKQSAMNMRFTLKFTSFTSRYDGCSEVEVADGMFSCPTGRCVHNSLLCENMNPCGDSRGCNATDNSAKQKDEGAGLNYVKFLVITIVVLFAIFALIQITLIVRNENKMCPGKHEPKEHLEAELMPMTNGHTKRANKDVEIEIMKS